MIFLLLLTEAKCQLTTEITPEFISYEFESPSQFWDREIRQFKGVTSNFQKIIITLLMAQWVVTTLLDADSWLLICRSQRIKKAQNRCVMFIYYASMSTLWAVRRVIVRVAFWPIYSALRCLMRVWLKRELVKFAEVTPEFQETISIVLSTHQHFETGSKLTLRRGLLW